MPPSREDKLCQDISFGSARVDVCRIVIENEEEGMYPVSHVTFVASSCLTSHLISSLSPVLDSKKDGQDRVARFISPHVLHFGWTQHPVYHFSESMIVSRWNV